MAFSQTFVCILTVIHLDLLYCRPNPNGENNIISSLEPSLHVNENDLKNSDNDNLSSRISSIADSSGKIVNNLVSTFESTGKIVSNIMEAKSKIAGPIINGTVETINAISDSHVLETGLGTIQTVLNSSARKSSQISNALANTASSSSRSEKALKLSDNRKVSNDKAKDLNNSIASILDSSGKLISDLLSAMITSAKVIGDVVEAKRKIVEPILENTARSLKTISDSKAIEKSLKTATNLASAGLQASIGVSTALARAGSASTPALIQGINSVNDVSLRVIRLGICALICPLQGEEEKESCIKENCGKTKQSNNNKLDENDEE